MKTRTAKTEYALALDQLTRYLTVRDHSRFELQQKLAKKFDLTLIEQVLAEAGANGLIAPEEEISERAERALRGRLKSRAYIEGQLRKRGLPVPAGDPELEIATARALVEKKFGPATELSYDDKGKAYRFMKYRGFDDHTIRMVLNGQDF